MNRAGKYAATKAEITAIYKVEDGIEETLTYCDFPSEH